MPTINQLVRKGREIPVKRNKVPALASCPQKRVLAMKHTIYCVNDPNGALHLRVGFFAKRCRCARDDGRNCVKNREK